MGFRIVTNHNYLTAFFDELTKIGQTSGGLGIPSGPSAAEMGGQKMTASSMGIPDANPMGSGAPPPAPMPSSGGATPAPGGGGSPAGGLSTGSLLSPQRQKSFGTGSLSPSESSATAAPSAAEFGG